MRSEVEGERATVFYLGFFGMLNLSFRVWVSDETYGG